MQAVLPFEASDSQVKAGRIETRLRVSISGEECKILWSEGIFVNNVSDWFFRFHT